MASLNPRRAEITELVASTRLSFEIFETFYTAQPSKYPAVQAIIERVKDEGDIYIGAIEDSITCSHDGIEICRDVISLYGFLADEKTSIGELQDFVNTLHERAGTARAQAMNMAKKFKRVAENLRELQEEISNLSVEDLKGETSSREQWKTKLNKLANRIVDILKPENNAQLTAGFGALLSTFTQAHPALLLIPIVLAIAMFVIRYTAVLYLKKNGKAQSELQAEEMKKHLQSLEANVNQYVAWWRDVEEKIKRIKDRLWAERVAEARQQLTKSEWIQLQKVYTAYNNEIQKLRDFYPNYRQRRNITY